MEAEINGVRLTYVEQGAGEPMVFVHGLVSDLRIWQPIKDEIAKKYRFIAYAQRYFGTGPWNDDGELFSVGTLSDDLVKFIVSLKAGPVHLVAWSYGGQVATVAALKNPSLVWSLILYEPSVMSVLPEASAEGKIAREDRAKMLALSVAASKANDSVKASRCCWRRYLDYRLPALTASRKRYRRWWRRMLVPPRWRLQRHHRQSSRATC
jgi:pimeloyl-ACP methyl ester carboxylesterase